MTTHDDDERITRRLSEALEVEARRNSLPTDFAGTVADRLAERKPRRLLSLVALPVLAGTMVVAVAGVGVLLSQSRAPISGPAPTPSATAPILVHASRWGLSFDYPADWTLSEANVNEHYVTKLGFVGSGTGSVPCTAITPPPSQSYPYGVECHDVFNLPPGTVLVQFVLNEGFGSDSPQMASPPAGYERLTVGGMPAFFSQSAQPFAGGDETLSWVLSVPGNLGASYHLTAGIRGPGLGALEEQVRAMVASIQFNPPAG